MQTQTLPGSCATPTSIMLLIPIIDEFICRRNSLPARWTLTVAKRRNIRGPSTRLGHRDLWPVSLCLRLIFFKIWTRNYLQLSTSLWCIKSSFVSIFYNEFTFSIERANIQIVSLLVPVGFEGWQPCWLSIMENRVWKFLIYETLLLSIFLLFNIYCPVKFAHLLVSHNKTKLL